MKSFKDRLAMRYNVLSELEKADDDEVVDNNVSDENETETETTTDDFQTGSSHPENWQTSLQSGKSTEEIRQDALELSNILQGWQNQVLQAQDYFEELTANTDKYLHMFNPILVKNLSRSKLETIARICNRFAKLATIV